MPTRRQSTHVGADSGDRGHTLWAEPATTAVTADQTGGAFTLSVLSLPSAWSRPRYIHHRLDECFVVVSGSLRFKVEDRDAPFVATAGDTIYVPRGLARSAELADAALPATVLLLETPASRAPSRASLLSGGWVEGVELLGAV